LSATTLRWFWPAAHHEEAVGHQAFCEMVGGDGCRPAFGAARHAAPIFVAIAAPALIAAATGR
jgi:hypothetical protein